MKTTAPLLVFAMTLSGNCVAEDIGLIEAARQLLSEKIHIISPAHAAKSSSEGAHLSKAMLTHEWNQHAAATYPAEPIVATLPTIGTAPKPAPGRGRPPTPRSQRNRH